MSRKPRADGWWAVFLMASLLFPLPVRGQVIPIKTVPVASGDQFLLFPSGNLAMGGVTMALTDTLGDPFVNPATGARVGESFVFGTPAFYSISDRNGTGRTLPLGTFFRSGDWFGSGAVSIQELEGARRANQLWRNWFWSAPPPELLSERSGRNLYAFGSFGRRFQASGLSVGLSGFWADLSAVEGVDLLYANSQQIQQSGTLSDLRLGVLKEWEGGRSLEFLLLRSRLRMAHDVTYLDWVWNEGTPDVNPWAEWVPRVEENLDHTDSWGAHLAYQRPLNEPGWRVGWSVTGNWKDHPKIPNYEIQNIPRDPGNTQAYALGVGLSKTEGDVRVAAEMALEPIRSETWADAAQDTVSATGSVIPAGEKTVENDFLFTNAVVRIGASWAARSRVTLKGGIHLRSISYDLDQFNRILATRREQSESWMEWTPTVGISAALGGVHLEYAFLLTTGGGRPGANLVFPDGAVPTFDSHVDIILAPSGPLTLQDATVTTHRLSVVVPIR